VAPLKPHYAPFERTLGLLKCAGFWKKRNGFSRRPQHLTSKRFLAQTSTLDFDEVRDLVYQLGCRWIPPSREALSALLTDATGPTVDL
jgi:hypothetical protein